VHEIDLGATAIARAASRLALEVLIPAFAPLPRNFSTPWVGYVYDFQHRYLPHLFTARGCRQRDREFSNMLTNASAVIVNARSVEADIAKFHPESTARIFSLPFGAAPQAAWLLPHESPATRLGIRRPYFIICNQFWQHKDHATAFAAFAHVAKLHPNIDLVCTGATEDYRDLAYFPTLKRALARDGISSRVHILGMVAKSDQIALVKDSIALIQPTLFEGGPGGGAVYDAVSLGVRCIVSDIAVNRELAEPNVYFFATGDACSLATQLMTAIEQPAPPTPGAEALCELGRARQIACGTKLWAAIEHARSTHKGKFLN
jgi:glycosyltransferase involved in cell wall biosynthesis